MLRSTVREASRPPGFRRVLVGAAVAASIAGAGYRAGALTVRGAAAATIVGSAILSAFEARGGILLGAFFGSGSALSRLPAAKQVARGSVARNERQVIANGGIGALVALPAFASSRGPVVAALAGCLAAATSDTWATEIGLQFGQRPRLILSGKPIARGMSGGITPSGTLGSAAGASAIGILAGVLYRDARLIPVSIAAGLAGSILDSVLGEVVQVKWRSLDGDSPTEESHGSVYASGIRWIDNDAVNLACTTMGGVAGWLFWRLATDEPGATCEAGPPAGGQASR